MSNPSYRRITIEVRAGPDEIKLIDSGRSICPNSTISKTVEDGRGKIIYRSPSIEPTINGDIYETLFSQSSPHAH